MPDQSTKSVLSAANAAVDAGDYEGFLAYCTEDTEWNFIRDKVLKGKSDVLNFMKKDYLEPPKNRVKQMIADGEWLTVFGEISMVDKDGNWNDFDYCDVWRLQDGKLAELRAYVI